MEDFAADAWTTLQTLWRLLGQRAIDVWNWPWTLPLLVVSLLAAAILVIHYQYRRWKTGWLSSQISRRIASTRRPAPPTRPSRITVRSVGPAVYRAIEVVANYTRERPLSDLRNFHYPSLLSFAFALLILAGAFVLGRTPPLPSIGELSLTHVWSFLTTDVGDESNGIPATIVGAFSGLTVVVIALVVFVAESIREDADSDRKRVLLRISWLWPLGLAATIVPFGFLWAPARGVTLILEIALAAATLWAFARVIRNLVDPIVRAESRAAFLKSRVRSIIADSIRQRVGNNIINETLGPGRRIETVGIVSSRYFLPGGQSDYLFIETNASGRLSDIQINEMQRTGEFLDHVARTSLGFSLRDSPPELPLATSSSESEGIRAKPLPVKRAFLLKRYGEDVPAQSLFQPDRQSILALPREFSKSPRIVEQVRASLPHIFRFSAGEAPSTAFRREMQSTKDQLALAIRGTSFGAIDDLRGLYLMIAEEFLEQLSQFGGGYAAGQADEERSNISGSWQEIDWLLVDLRELITIAIASDNTSIVGKIAYLPFAISSRAVLARDHLLFRQFLEFSSYLFWSSLGVQTEGTRGWLADRSWTWPSEISSVYVERLLEPDGSDEASVAHGQDFALFALKVLQDLLKLCVDHNKATLLASWSALFMRIFERFRSDYRFDDVSELEFRLNGAGAEEIARINEEINVRRQQSQIAAKLDVSINAILLAITGRALTKWLEARDDTAQKMTLQLLQQLPSEIKDLASAYAEASEYGTADAWGWDNWDLVADGQAHWIDVHTNINRAFAVAALQKISQLNGNAKLPVSRTLADMAREDNAHGLIPVLDDISSRSEYWGPLLTVEQTEAIPRLREALDAVRASQKEADSQRTRNAPLDPALVDGFRAELKESMSKQGHLRAIFERSGALVRTEENPGPSVLSFGYNQVDDKNAFISQTHTTFAGWGRAYGEGLGRTEDARVFRSLVSAAGNQIDLPVDEVGREMVRHVSETPQAIILHTLSHRNQRQLFESTPEFTPVYRQTSGGPLDDIQGYSGVISVSGRRVPVLRALSHQDEDREKVLLVDVRLFASWMQYAPSDDPSDTADRDGDLLIRIVDLNVDDERRAKIIESNPNWLKDVGDKELHLRGRVLVNVFEKIGINILDPSMATVISLTR